MYCIKCGVELCEGEVRCPLCKTEVVHPDFMDKKKEPLYPEGVMPKKEKRIQLWAILMTALCFIALSVVVVCDVQFNHSLTWSVIVMGAMVLFYEIFVLPGWFSSPNPVIFVPCGFAAGILYLLYIDLLTKGSWFLSFGLPVAGGIAIIVCTVVTLMKYVPKGRYFIFGGAFIGFGAQMLMTEMLMNFTFESIRFIGWSLYPLVVFALLGGFLIFLGICHPVRELMERKFFI